MSALIPLYDLLAETEVYAYPVDELLWHQQPQPSLGNLPYLQNLAVTYFLIGNDFWNSISYLILYILVIILFSFVLDWPSAWRRNYKTGKDGVYFLCLASLPTPGKPCSKPFKLCTFGLPNLHSIASPVSIVWEAPIINTSWVILFG